MDTANDYRILMAEYALSLLERRAKQWGMPWPFKKGRALELVSSIGKTLKRIRYSYLPPEDLVASEDMQALVSLARELAGIMLPGQPVPRLEERHKLALAEMRWALSILIGLPARIRLGPANRPEYAVDVVGAEVSRVEPLPGADRLRVTRASIGSAVFTVVTNIESIREGEVRAIAILPPAVFRGVISEAMYASEPIDGKYVGKRVPRKLLSGEVAAKVISLLGRR